MVNVNSTILFLTKILCIIMTRELYLTSIFNNKSSIKTCLATILTKYDHVNELRRARYKIIGTTQEYKIPDQNQYVLPTI